MTAPRGTDAEQGAPDPAAADAAPAADRTPSDRGGADRTGSATAEGPLEPGADPGPRWAQGAGPGAGRGEASTDATTVLPGGAEGARRPSAPRPAPARPAQRGDARPAGTSTRAAVGRARRARLTLKRIDAWSVFLFSLVASVFVGIALVVAVAVLYSVLGTLGITQSLNELFTEVTGGDALLTTSRIVGGAAVLAAVNVVFLTLLATLSALLYNLCASFTGGIELVLGERD